MNKLKRLFRVFLIRKEERLPSVFALMLIVGLNALMISHYYSIFAHVRPKTLGEYIKQFAISGYDPLTYNTLTYWHHVYEVHRHPLLTWMLYPLSVLNGWLTDLFGVNTAQFVIAVFTVFCSFYAWLLLLRLLREVMGLRRGDACLLSLMFLSMAYVMVGMSVPDHFVFSTFLLIFTLYVAGKRLSRPSASALSSIETFLLIVVSAGVTLTNGVKIALASLFVNGRRFFRPVHLLLAIVLPMVLLWFAGEWQYKHDVVPREQRKQVKKKRFEKKQREKAFFAFKDSTSLTDSVAICKAFDRMMARKDSVKLAKPKVSDAHSGKPINNEKYIRWTDISTPRGATIVHNLFGESLMLHRNHLLEDTLRSRPVIVHYRWWVNYVIEALVLLLFLAGIWVGRRDRLLWLVMSWFGFDMALHLLLGFGINEIYINSPHWLFVIPFAVAYLLRHFECGWLRWLVAMMTLFMLCYNLVVYVLFLLS